MENQYVVPDFEQRHTSGRRVKNVSPLIYIITVHIRFNQSNSIRSYIGVKLC